MATINISGSIVSHWIWGNAEHLKWWLDLLLMASQEDTSVTHDGISRALSRGQLIASVSYLSSRWGKGAKAISNYLHALEDDGMITRSMTGRITSVITIVGYNEYAPDTAKAHAEPHKGELDTKRLVDFFNSEMAAANAQIPTVRSIQGKRKTHVMARCREHGKEAIADAIKKAASSDFLNGCNNRGWVASFDWIFLPNNFPKVLEGNYDRQESKENKRGRAETSSVTAEDYDGAF